jgi:hypothetical protein
MSEPVTVATDHKVHLGEALAAFCTLAEDVLVAGPGDPVTPGRLREAFALVETCHREVRGVTYGDGGVVATRHLHDAIQEIAFWLGHPGRPVSRIALVLRYTGEAIAHYTHFRAELLKYQAWREASDTDMGGKS